MSKITRLTAWDLATIEAALRIALKAGEVRPRDLVLALADKIMNADSVVITEGVDIEPAANHYHHKAGQRTEATLGPTQREVLRCLREHGHSRGWQWGTRRATLAVLQSLVKHGFATYDPERNVYLPILPDFTKE